jgi:hypothetical protein
MARIPPRRQGDLGEFSAMEWLGSQGYGVWVPLNHSPNIDLIADDGLELVRVQVKTCTLYCKRRWEVQLATLGGNRSWSGLTKRFARHNATSCSCSWGMGAVGSFLRAA